MERLTTIELYKEEMKFSAGHFTIFSETARESLHGHNFTVYVSITGLNAFNGIVVDYTIFKEKLIRLCRRWDSIFILPTRSPYLKIEETPTHYVVQFAEETLTFLKRDVLLLPLENATVEEFARLILEELLGDLKQLPEAKISRMVVKVFSGPGQSASVEWAADEQTA
jgi:6-pyruvoyltetrahydropterin/6-carboxytetrahydropterin synthase